MKVDKEILQELAYGDDYGDFKVISTDIVDTSRWSIVSRQILEKDGKFYETTFSEGATEMQDERAYESEGDEIELDQVYPVKKEITVYVKKRGERKCK